MLTDEQIASLTEEQKAELLTKLQPKKVEEEVVKVEGQTDVVVEPQVVVKEEVVVEKQEEVVVEKKVELPNYDAKFADLEKKFDGINTLLTEKDKVIDDLSKKLKDLEDRTPTGILTPKVSDEVTKAAKDKEAKILEQYKKSGTYAQ